MKIIEIIEKAFEYQTTYNATHKELSETHNYFSIDENKEYVKELFNSMNALTEKDESFLDFIKKTEDTEELASYLEYTTSWVEELEEDGTILELDTFDACIRCESFDNLFREAYGLYVKDKPILLQRFYAIYLDDSIEEFDSWLHDIIYNSVFGIWEYENFDLSYVDNWIRKNNYPINFDYIREEASIDWIEENDYDDYDDESEEY